MIAWAQVFAFRQLVALFLERLQNLIPGKLQHTQDLILRSALLQRASRRIAASHCRAAMLRDARNSALLSMRSELFHRHFASEAVLAPSRPAASMTSHQDNLGKRIPCSSLLRVEKSLFGSQKSLLFRGAGNLPVTF